MDTQKFIEELMKKDEKKSGFFDLPKSRGCQDPGHNPPTHMVIPQGKGYRHVCPKCGKVQIVTPPQISF